MLENARKQLFLRQSVDSDQIPFNCSAYLTLELSTESKPKL
jgi:hypothetical protein